MNYPQIAAAVYQRCNHFDPYLPALSADLARAWGALFEKHRLNQDDLLAGADAVYDEHGSGYRPLPKDIIDAARTIRRDRAERETDTELDARQNFNARRIQAMVAELAETKTVDHALSADDLCPACQRRPIIAADDIARGMCDHCAPHVPQPKPDTNDERQNA